MLLTVFDLDGSRQGKVHFSAQQGQEYGIFAWRTNDSIDPGTIVLNWRIASASETPAPLREQVFDDLGPNDPSYVIAGQNASVWYWTTDATRLQSLYVSADGAVSVRTFYDSDGLPHKVLDERAGSWMLIRRYDAKNVDFWFYDADGTYQGGLAVFEVRGRYYYAAIDGEPVHAGKRITGSLQPSGASWTGSYTLQVDMSMIRQPKPVPRDIAALIARLSPDEEGRTGMVTGWRSRLAALLGPLGAWLSPGDAVALEVSVQDALTVGGVALLAVGVGVGSMGFATAGVAALVAKFFARDISQLGIRESPCPDQPEISRDFCHLAANNLAAPGGGGLTVFARNMVEWASNRTNHLRETIASATQALSSTLYKMRGYPGASAPCCKMADRTPTILQRGQQCPLQPTLAPCWRPFKVSSPHPLGVKSNA